LNLKKLLEGRKYAEAWDETAKWEVRYRSLMSEIEREGKHWVAFSKALVEVTGLHAGLPRPPQQPLSKAQYERIEKLVQDSEIYSK